MMDGLKSLKTWIGLPARNPVPSQIQFGAIPELLPELWATLNALTNTVRNLRSSERRFGKKASIFLAIGVLGLVASSMGVLQSRWETVLLSVPNTGAFLWIGSRDLLRCRLARDYANRMDENLKGAWRKIEFTPMGEEDQMKLAAMVRQSLALIPQIERELGRAPAESNDG